MPPPRSKIPGFELPLRDRREYETFDSGLSADSRRAMAHQHMVGRTERVVKLLVATASMAAAARRPGASERLRSFNVGHVDCSKGELQAVSYPDPDAAAHYLPGQIKIGGLPPWEFLTNLRQREFLMLLFQDTDRLRVAFNQTDWRWKRGRSASDACCRSVSRW